MLAGATRASLRRLALVEAGSLLPRVGPLGERTSVPGTRSPGTHPWDGCWAALRETLVAPGVVAERLLFVYQTRREKGDDAFEVQFRNR